TGAGAGGPGGLRPADLRDVRSGRSTEADRGAVRRGGERPSLPGDPRPRGPRAGFGQRDRRRRGNRAAPGEVPRGRGSDGTAGDAGRFGGGAGPHPRTAGRMNRLWVDDLRPAPDGWTWAKSSAE